MRILIAPDKFKGCLSARQVADAIAAGLRQIIPGVEIDLCPMADGGEGIVDAMVAATGGRKRIVHVIGPLPQMQAEAVLGLLGDRHTAVLEMSSASGLHLVPQHLRNPLHTTTYGTGQLLMEAADSTGIRRIIIGIGGSATTDAGIGCLQACECPIETRTGVVGVTDPPLCGRDVERVVSIEPPLEDNPLLTVDLSVACDVDSPLFGPRGAAPVFGPQKGATPEIVARLDRDLEHLANRTGMITEAQAAGAGAAGGLGFGLSAFLGAKLQSGFDLVAAAVVLNDRIARADLVITGEGRLDGQTLSGKTVAGVARLCAREATRCIALAGIVEEGVEAMLLKNETPCECLTIGEGVVPVEESIQRAGELLTRSAANLARRLETKLKVGS